MAQVETPNIFGQFLQGKQAGEQERRRKTLSDFIQPALSGDQNALSQVYAADPDAGLQVQGLAQRQQTADHEQRMGQLEMAARAWRSATPEMRQQLYPSIAELTESVLPQFAGKIPRDYNPQFEANIDKFLSGFAPVEDNTPSAIRELQMLQANPELAELDMRRRTAGFDRPQLIQTDQGYAWATPQGATPLNYGGGMAPATANPSAAAGFDSLHAAVPGLRVTSGLRTPEQNAKAGGVPNSFHLTGQAIDIGTPTPEQRARIKQWAAANNYEVIENYKDGHLHLEPRGIAPQGGGRVMPKPSESEETFSQPQVVTNPQTGKQELVQFGNRGGRRVVTDYTPGPTDRDAKPPTEGERKAATLLSRLEFSENQLREAVKSDKGAASPSLLAEGARRIPFIGGDTTANAFTPEARQRVEAAQLDILDAALTLGTGAAYTREQLEGYRRSYFPQLGDSDATIKDKAARLENIINSARIAAGRAGPAATSGAAPGASSNGWSIKVKP